MMKPSQHNLTRTKNGTWLASAAALLLGAFAVQGQADKPTPVVLPAPQMQGGKPLMTTLQQRQTTREFQPGKLTPQTLANLLWAGFGINRPENEHRTAPSAMNSQEVDIYVALPDALYVYEAKPHRLKPVLTGDFRSKTSGQPFAKESAAVFIYVATLPRLEKAKPETRSFYAGDRYRLHRPERLFVLRFRRIGRGRV